MLKTFEDQQIQQGCQIDATDFRTLSGCVSCHFQTWPGPGMLCTQEWLVLFDAADFVL